MRAAIPARGNYHGSPVTLCAHRGSVESCSDNGAELGNRPRSFASAAQRVHSVSL